MTNWGTILHQIKSSDSKIEIWEENFSKYMVVMGSLSEVSLFFLLGVFQNNQSLKMVIFLRMKFITKLYCSI